MTQSRKAKSTVKINKTIFYNFVKKYFPDVDLPARKDFEFLRSFNSRTYILNYCNSDYSVIFNFCLEIKSNRIILSSSETCEVYNLAI